MASRRSLGWLVFGLLLSGPCFAHHGLPHEPGDEAELDRLYRLSDKHFHEGDYFASINCHRQTIAIDPTFVESYTNSAWLLWSMGRELAALSLLERGRERNPDEYELHFDIGFYHYQAKRYGFAAKEFARAADCECPQHVHRMLAHAREKKGDLPGALRVWQDLHEEHPDDAVVERHRKRLTQLLASEGK